MKEELYTGGLHSREIQPSKILFFQDGYSEYKILKAKSNPSKEIDEVRELNDFIHLATGVYLDVIYDEAVVWTEESKYIVLGDTKVSPPGLRSTDMPEVKTSGYKIKTIGNSVFINGYTEEGRIFGIYDFLSVLFDFDFFAENEYSLKTTKDAYMPVFDIVERPDFQYREGTYGNIVREDALLHRFRFNATKNMYTYGHMCHNTFCTLPPSKYFWKHPDWYVLNRFGEPSQICWSNEELRAEYVKNLKKRLEEKPDAIMLMGMEDNLNWCECPKCKALEEKYGKKSVSAIHFANKVVEEINGPRKKKGKKPYQFLIFAYYATNDAPVVYDEKQGKYLPMDESVILNEDLGLFYAPGGAQFTHFFDTDERNAHYFEELRRWQALTDKIHIWTYPVFSFFHMAPYPFGRAMKHNYRVFLENNVRSILDQTQHEQCNYTTFCHLHAYLQSKLLWNVNLDQEALTDKFFKQYFKRAERPMRNYYDEINAWYEYLFANTDAQSYWSYNMIRKEYFPEEKLEAWKQYFQSAYQLLEEEKDETTYHKLKDRIRVEELSLDYMRMEIYGETWSEQALQRERLRFYNDFTSLGLQRVNEIERVEETLWKRWKIEEIKKQLK